MLNDTTTEIRRHADGSIDYAYYAGLASAARNTEFRRMARGCAEIRKPSSPLLSVLATVVLLAIVV